MVKFEESRKILLESYKEYVACDCKMNGALLVLKDCIDSALRQQYLNKELDGRRIAYIKCEPSTLSFSVDVTFYLLPFEPFSIDEDWSAKEKSIMAEVNACIINNGNYFTITKFNEVLGNLKHHLTPVKRMIRYFYMDNIDNMNINNIIIR